MRGRVPPRWAIAVAAGLAVAAVLVIAYRVLAPAEVVTPARAPYPTAPSAPAGVVGTFSAAPLIVDGRLRVYAGPRQVRADGPVDLKTQWSPYWSYRRWPAQLVGIVAAGRTVVSQWSDGELVGLSAERGRVLWRAPGPKLPGSAYQGRRTGAATVYAPPHLYTAGSVVVATGPDQARGYDAGSGRELWSLALPGCDRTDFTTGERFAWNCGGTLAAVDATTGRRLPDWSAPDRVVPLGCVLGRSGCRGLHAGNRGYLWSGEAPQPAPALDPAGSWLVDDVAVDPALTARSPSTGRELWRWSGGTARVVAVQPHRVHLLTSACDLVTVDAATGVELSRFPATAYGQATTWSPGASAAMAGFLVLERLHPGARPDDPNSAYYFEARPVLLART